MARKITRFLERMKRKLLVTFIIIVLFFAVVVGRLTYFGVERRNLYEKQVLSQQKYDSIAIPYRRGDIVDRKNTVLATSTKVYNLIIEPKNIIKDEDSKVATINALTTYFDIDEEKLNAYLQDNTSLYKVVLKELTYDQITPFNEYIESDKGKDVTGVWFEEEYQRYYPYGTLACHALGYVSSGNVGNWGIEQYYNDYLNGTDGREYGYLTADLQMERTTKSAQNGYTIVSTLDANIQNIVENRIAQYQRETGSKNTSIIVMDPNNGEVLAMANSKTYDLNDPYNNEALYYLYRQHDVGTALGDLTPEEETTINDQINALSNEDKISALNEVWRNYAISDTYEPGSTFKTYTVAAGLEEGILKGDETYSCDGGEQIDTYYIKCHKNEGHGVLTLGQALAQSCNDALMQIAAQIGRSVFSKYQTVFGFGQKTSIDLPGEANTSGLIYTEDQLNTVELATCSFGQGLNCSMIQMITAFCSVVNGGNFYEPHIVKQIVDEDGKVIKNVDSILIKKTLSQSTCDTLKQYLYETIENGTGRRAQIEGYTIGGKTGTAQKLPRADEKYVISFIGFAPVEDPQFVIYVVVDEPNVANQSINGDATLIAHDIMAQLLPYLNISQTQTTDTSTNSNSPATTASEGNTTEGSSTEGTTTESPQVNNTESSEGGAGLNDGITQPTGDNSTEE